MSHTFASKSFTELRASVFRPSIQTRNNSPNKLFNKAEQRRTIFPRMDRDAKDVICTKQTKTVSLQYGISEWRYLIPNLYEQNRSISVKTTVPQTTLVNPLLVLSLSEVIWTIFSISADSLSIVSSLHCPILLHQLLQKPNSPTGTNKSSNLSQSYTEYLPAQHEKMGV